MILNIMSSFKICVFHYIYIFFVNYIEKSYVQDLLIFGPMRKDKFGDTDVYVRLILQSFIKIYGLKSLTTKSSDVIW